MPSRPGEPAARSAAVTALPIITESPAAAMLSYADVENPEGVTDVTVVRVRPDVRTIYIPPPPPRRLAVRPLLRAAGVIAVVAAGCLILGAVLRRQGLPDVTEMGGALVVGFSFQCKWPRFRKRLTFEVTPFDFRLTSAGIFGVGRSRRSRFQIREIKLNAVSNRVVLSLVNFNAEEIFVSDDPAIAQQVVDELNIALSEIPPAPVDQQRLNPDPAAGLRPGLVRTILQRTSAALAVAAAAGAPFTRGYSLLLLLPAAVLIGIAAGTRSGT